MKTKQKVYWFVRNMETGELGEYHKTKKEARVERDALWNDGIDAMMFRASNFSKTAF